ncbi:MAG: ubiquinone biosynthesis protein, partial [Micavibrio aeruginosavorus]
EKTADAQKYLAMKRDEFEKALQDRTNGYVGNVKMLSNPESWPLMLLTTDRITGTRSALAAEAAHVLSPIGAQGLNLSLRDVAALAETLTDAARMGEDIGGVLVLSRYEKRRRIDIKSHVAGIDGLNRAVANDVLFIQDLRRLGLKGLETIPALKHLAMHQGLAPSMDDSRLLAGAAL